MTGVVVSKGRVGSQHTRCCVKRLRGRPFVPAAALECAPVCRPPIITIVWEGLSACKRSHPAPRTWSVTSRALPDRIPDLQPCLLTSGGGAYLFTLQSHRWITVLVISGFGGLIQIPLFVNTATFPTLIQVDYGLMALVGSGVAVKTQKPSADFINLRLNRD